MPTREARLDRRSEKDEVAASNLFGYWVWAWRSNLCNTLMMAVQQGGFASPPDASASEPAQFQREHGPSPSLLRIKKDIAEFFADPPTGIFISPEENDVIQVQAVVIGPQGTPYEGGFFRFEVRFPSNYPMASPHVKLLTTDAGRVRFNPNLYACGKVCLSILGTWSGPPWSPAQSLSSVLISIQSLLNEEPYYNEPGFVKGTSLTASQDYNAHVQHETIRVAVCDAVEDCLRDNSSFPPALKDAALKKFADSYSKYEETVKARLHLNGTRMKVGALAPSADTFQYETLLTRLQDLTSRVDKLNEAAAPAGNP